MIERFPRTLKCLVAALLTIIYLGGSARAEFVVHPAITVSEEYSDNIFLQNRYPQADYITRLTPAVTAQYQSSLLTWHGNYTLDYLHFQRHDQQTETRHTVNSRVFLEAVPQTVYFEGIHNFRRVSLSVVTDFTQQTATVLQVDQSTLTLHPYIVLMRARNTTLQYGHKIIEIRYSNGLGIDRTQNIDYVESTTVISSRVSVTAGVRQTREQNHFNDFIQNDIYARINYMYAESSSIYGQTISSWYRYDINGNSSDNRLSGGFSHAIAPYTIAFDSGVAYLQDPLRISTRQDYYRASINRVTERSSLTLSRGWNKYLNMTTNTVTSVTQDGQGVFIYRLTPRTTGTIQTRYQDTDDIASTFHTRLSESALRLDYRLRENTTLSTAYSYVSSYSPGYLFSNYIVNRGFIEISMLF